MPIIRVVPAKFHHVATFWQQTILFAILVMAHASKAVCAHARPIILAQIVKYPFVTAYQHPCQQHARQEVNVPRQICAFANLDIMVKIANTTIVMLLYFPIPMCVHHMACVLAHKIAHASTDGLAKTVRLPFASPSMARYLRHATLVTDHVLLQIFVNVIMTILVRNVRHPFASATQQHIQVFAPLAMVLAYEIIHANAMQIIQVAIVKLPCALLFLPTATLFARLETVHA